jgi:hypothetical protein
MKTIIAIIAVVLLPGCVCNVAWRGTLSYTEQKATTDGATTSTPTQRDTSIAAEKTTDVQADLPLK